MGVQTQLFKGKDKVNAQAPFHTYAPPVSLKGLKSLYLGMLGYPEARIRYVVTNVEAS